MGEPGAWHGWSHESDAVFLTPTEDGEHIGLYVQQGRSVELAGVFVDPAMAQLFMDWMDGALTETGQANSELLRVLETEQPLLFQKQPPMPGTVPAEDDDDFSE